MAFCFAKVSSTGGVSQSNNRLCYYAPTPPRVNEDYAIVSIPPLPNHPLQVLVVCEVVEKFLVEHMHLGIRDIQPTHLGQVLVHFENIFVRDLLINNSPHPYGGVNFTVELEGDSI
jgi:hypothetical protein